jgi:hypothetical protein
MSEDEKPLNLPDLNQEQIKRGKKGYTEMSREDMAKIIRTFKSMDPRLAE